MAIVRSKQFKTEHRPVNVYFKNIPEDPHARSAILNKSILGISVGSEIFEGDGLLCTLRCLAVNRRSIHKLDFLIGGLLQRWNWWLFSKNLKDAELAILMQHEAITADISIDNLALLLSRIFYASARKAEDEWLVRNGMRIIDEFSTTDYRPQFIRWETVVPISSQEQEIEIIETNDTDELEVANDTNNPFGNYLVYREKIGEMCAQGGYFTEAFRATVNQFLSGKRPIIEKQIRRLVKANPLLKSLDDKKWWQVVQTCCYNYLLEEYPLLYPTLFDKGYTSVIYNGPASSAGEKVHALFPDKPIFWAYLLQEQIKQMPKVDPDTAYTFYPDRSSQFRISTLLQSRSRSGDALSLTPTILGTRVDGTDHTPLSGESKPATIHELNSAGHQPQAHQLDTSRSVGASESDSDTEQRSRHSSFDDSSQGRDRCASRASTETGVSSIPSSPASVGSHTPNSGRPATSPMPIPGATGHDAMNALALGQANSPLSRSVGSKRHSLFRAGSLSPLPALFLQPPVPIKASISDGGLKQTKANKTKPEAQPAPGAEEKSQVPEAPRSFKR